VKVFVVLLIIIVIYITRGANAYKRQVREYFYVARHIYIMYIRAPTILICFR